MSVNERFKEVIREQADAQLSDSIFHKRENIFCDPPQGKALVVVGVRRSGKSTYLFQNIKKYIKNSAVLSINFDDERLIQMTAHDLGKWIESYFELYPEKIECKNHVFCLDEIQYVKNWELFVARILRNTKNKVYITGSSSKMLSTDIATSLRGRSITQEMFPFSFREFLQAESISPKERDFYDLKNKVMLKKALIRYLYKGGFPEILKSAPDLHQGIFQNYFETILYKDLVERLDLSHPLAAKNILTFLIRQVGSLYSINKIYERLKSQSFQLQKNFVNKVLDGAEDCYSFFSVPIYSESVSKQAVNPKKIYCIDTGLAYALQAKILQNEGRFLENLIFLHLRRQLKEICYYRTRSSKEVDFIFHSIKGKKELVQVTVSLNDPGTYEREVSALRDAMAELGLKSAIVVTLMDEESEIKVPEGVIQVIPVVKYLTVF